MGRCTQMRGLGVHHRRRDGGNGLANTEVLCKQCHEAASSFGASGESPPEFSDETKQTAVRRAYNRCECTRTGGCHQVKE